MAPFDDRYRAAIHQLLPVSSGVRHLLTSHTSQPINDDSFNKKIVYPQHVCISCWILKKFLMKNQNEFPIVLTVI